MRKLRAIIVMGALAVAVLLSSCGRKTQIRTYALGEKASLGRLTYAAFETQWLTQIPLEPAPRLPQNRFFLVRMSIVNGGSGEVIVPGLSLEDDKGQSYPELQNGEGVPQWMGLLRSVKPAEAAQGNVVFDVPPGHYKLRVSHEDGVQFAYVDLPLTFGAETPEIPTPGVPKQ